MDSKLIISSVLTDLTLASKTKFIEAKDNEDLIKLAKSKGIDLPSPDLACFETYYCELDKPNLNNAMLTKKAAEEGINTLIGKQINLNHKGKNYVIGYTIDAKIKDNMVIVTGILFKSLFPDEFDEIKQLFEEGNLFVSFELWNKEPETGNSIVELMDNGIKKITKMIAHGVGLLLKGVKPACKKAQVFKLLANKKDNGTQTFVEDERFAYASFSNEVEECKHCTTCTCEKEEHKVELYELLVAEQALEITEDEIASFEKDYEETTEIEEAKKLKYEERQKLSDDDFAVVVTVKNKVTGEPRKIRMFPIQDEAHVRNALARLPQAEETLKKLGISKEEVLKKILKRAKELNMDELLKKYEKSSEETKIEAETQPVNTGAETEAKIEETAEVKVEIEVKPEETKEEIVIEKKEEAEAVNLIDKKVVSVINEETITIIDTMDGKVERKGMRKTTRKFDDGTEEVFSEEYQAVQTYTEAQLEEKVNAVKAEKDAEIATLKSEHEKVLAEKDVEVKNKIEELGKKDQEIADLKNPIVEEKKAKELTVGTVEIKDRNKEIQKGIDERAFGKR